jgi:hypothetical protein
MRHGEKTRRLRRIAKAVILVACAPSAQAASTIQVGEKTTFDYGMIVNYGVAVRAKSPAPVLLAPDNINGDDGNRNFKRGSLVSNSVNVLLEGDLRRDNIGLFVRGSAIYDNVYHRRNDNDAPGTVNKSGPANEFTSAARHYQGNRARLLDAYVYGTFDVSSTTLNLRAGEHVVQWGEALYFPNIAGAQGAADAIKANVPGAEVKDVLLPTGQVSAQWSINPDISVLGYYQYRFKANELPPAGSYFSQSDVTGPGADRLLIINPLLANPQTAALPGLPQTIAVPRGADIKARDSGQWGVGTRFRISEKTELGVYHLRYHDKNPNVVIATGTGTLYAGNPALGIPAITTPPGVFPVGYQVKYFEDIKLTGASFSTEVQGVSVGGEVSYRDGAPVLVSVQGAPTATRAKSWQAQVSAIKAISKTALADSMMLVGEVGVHQVSSVTPISVAGAQFDQLSNTKSSWGYALGWTLSYSNVFNGWDLSVPISFQHLVNGKPAVAGSFGALTGKGNQRLSVGTTFKYLGNFELGLAYNAFLGGADPQLRPLEDRDYVTFNAKYSF